jgi:drug/metabolite transporter (DMT)-like permease
MSLIWGIPYLLIRIAVRHGIPAADVAFGRVTLAAAVLLAVAWRTGTLPSLRGCWRWLAVYAVLEIAIPFSLIAAGEQRISSSLAAIVIAAVPLIGAVLALRLDHSERPSRGRAIGLFVGFGGVVLLMGVDVSGSSSELLGAAMVLVAAVGYALGPMVAKHHLVHLDPAATMGASLALAALILAPGAALDPPRTVPGLGAILAVVALGLVCTTAAFVIFMLLIREAGTSRSMVITYINPVIAVALGVTLLGEQPGAGAIAGLLLILAGCWLSTGGTIKPGPRVQREAEAPAEALVQA